MPSPEPFPTATLTIHPAASDQLPLFRFADRDIVGACLLAARFTDDRDAAFVDPFLPAGPLLQLWFPGGSNHLPTTILVGAQAQALWDALAGCDRLLVRAGPYRLVRDRIVDVRRAGHVFVTLAGGLCFGLSDTRDVGPGAAAEFLADWDRGVPPAASQLPATADEYERNLEKKPLNDEAAQAPT